MSKVIIRRALKLIDYPVKYKTTGLNALTAHFNENNFLSVIYL